MALTLPRLKEARISIPGALKVAAFGAQRDEPEPSGDEVLTAVEPALEMGKATGELLLKQFNGEEISPRNQVIQGRIIRSGSQVVPDNKFNPRKKAI
jgi:DNA-binding LacI/PurR family transcriptional regulator